MTTKAAFAQAQQARSQVDQALRDQIVKMQQLQANACQQLEAVMGQMRAKTQSMIQVQAADPSDPLAAQRLELEQSGWSKLVTIAAIVDAGFRAEVAAKAQQTLIDRKIIQPPAPEQPASEQSAG